MKLTINEVAQCLRLPVTTVDRWIHQGRIPIQKSSNGYPLWFLCFFFPLVWPGGYLRLCSL